MNAKDPRWITADGKPITDGMLVWDYNLEQVRVRVTGQADPTDEFHHYWDGWFETEHLDGTRASLMNGERMSVRDPRR